MSVPFDDYTQMATAARCDDHAAAAEPDPACAKCVALVLSSLDVVDALYPEDAS